MNPYKEWLGISTRGRKKPNYFKLLGVPKNLEHKETLKMAAQAQAYKLKRYRDGEHAEVCEKILKRIKKAYKVLSNPEMKAKYIAKLKKGKPEPKSKLPIHKPRLTPIAPEKSGKFLDSDLHDVLDEEPDSFKLDGSIKSGSSIKVGSVKSGSFKSGSFKASQSSKSNGSFKLPAATSAAAAKSEPDPNRPLLLVAIGGGVMLATLLLVGIWYLFLRPDSSPTQSTTQIANAGDVKAADVNSTASATNVPEEAEAAQSNTESDSTSQSLDLETVSTSLDDEHTLEFSDPIEDLIEPDPNGGTIGITHLEQPSSTGQSENPEEPGSVTIPPADSSPDTELVDNNDEPGSADDDPFGTNSEIDLEPSEPKQPSLPSGFETSAPVTSSGNLKKLARSVLSTHCATCHDKNSGKGKFDFVMERSVLIHSGHVTPYDPDKSLLLRRMLDADKPMPPSSIEKRPTQNEIKIVRDWIRTGAE